MTFATCLQLNDLLFELYDVTSISHARDIRLVIYMLCCYTPCVVFNNVCELRVFISFTRSGNELFSNI